MPRARTPLIDLFMRRVDKSGEHWLWTGPVAGKDGYPMFHFRDPEQGMKVVTRSAHRWLWEHTHGPLPDGWTVDHVCRTILCVKPVRTHLEPVPHRTNDAGADRCGDDQCPQDALRQRSRVHRREHHHPQERQSGLQGVSP